MKLFFPLFLNALLGGEQRRGTAFAAAFPGYDSAEVPQQRRQNGLVRGSNKNNVVMLVEDLPDHDHEPFTHRRELIEYITPDDITFIGDDSFGCDRDLADRDIYGCKKGEYAACYYQTSTSKGKKKSTEDSGEYHTTCWDYEKYGEPELGNSVGTSTDKYWAACAPCDCAPAITSQSPAPTIKVGKQEKKLQCPPVPIICGPDTDKDGIPDFYDNCPLVYNPDQTWVDYCPYAEEEAIVIIADLLSCRPIKEVCFPDTDDDGVPDFFDNCPLVFNPDQENTVGSGEGDACRCDAAESVFVLDLGTDENPEQTSWTVKDNNDEVVATGGDYDQVNTLYSEDICLDPTVCYEFTISDTGGNGGTEYLLYSSDGVFYGPLTDFDDSDDVIYFGNCCEGELERQATLFLPTDGQPMETSWSLKVSGGEDLLSVESGAYSFSNDFYIISLGCLDPSTLCYEFTILDSAGDGLDTCFFYIQIGDDFYFFDDCFTGSSKSFTFGTCPPPDATDDGLQLTDTVLIERLQVHTTFISDVTNVAVLTVSVPYDQLVTVDIVHADTDSVAAALFSGTISADSPQVVTFGLGEDISTLKYKAEIKGVNEAENIELLLFKPPSSMKNSTLNSTAFFSEILSKAGYDAAAGPPGGRK